MIGHLIITIGNIYYFKQLQTDKYLNVKGEPLLRYIAFLNYL